MLNDPKLADILKHPHVTAAISRKAQGAPPQTGDSTMNYLSAGLDETDYQALYRLTGLDPLRRFT